MEKVMFLHSLNNKTLQMILCILCFSPTQMYAAKSINHNDINYNKIISDTNYIDQYLTNVGESIFIEVLSKDIKAGKRATFKALLHIYFKNTDFFMRNIRSIVDMALIHNALATLDFLGQTQLLYIACGISEKLTYELSIAKIHKKQEAIAEIILYKKKHNDNIKKAVDYCALHLDYLEKTIKFTLYD